MNYNNQQQQQFIIEPLDREELAQYFQRKLQEKERNQGSNFRSRSRNQDENISRNFGRTQYITCARNRNDDDDGYKKKRYKDDEDKEEKREKRMKTYDDDKEFMNEARGPLGGGSYAVTGVFEDITRDKLEEFIKKNGGRLVTQVTKVCDYVIYGKLLDDGRQVTDGQKYKKGLALKKKLMTEKEFEAFCKIRFQNPDFLLGRKKKKDTTENAEDNFVGQEDKSDELMDITDISQLLTDDAINQQLSPTPSPPLANNLPSNRPNLGKSRTQTPVQNSIVPSKDKPQQTIKPLNIPLIFDEEVMEVEPNPNETAGPGLKITAITQLNKQPTSSIAQIMQKPKLPSAKPLPTGTQLWTDKYAPQSFSDLVGNKSVIVNFREWLVDWEDVVIRGQKKDIQPKGGWGRAAYQDLPKINARACLISGPPGIGKTSSVRIIAKELGYNLMEFNASDNRSKKSIENLLQNMTTCKSIDKYQQYNLMSKNKKEKTLILMDEVDGVSANDRGGLGALILIIKKTLIPIVCVANDSKHRKLVSLLNHCYDLKFAKPSNEDMLKRIKFIAEKENLKIDRLDIYTQIFDMSGQDIRQVINMIQMQKTTSNQITKIDMNAKQHQVQKDWQLMLNAFTASQKFLNRKEFHQMSFKDKVNLFFIDPDLMPMFIQENYLTAFGQLSKPEDLMRLADVADYISMGDQINNQIRQHQDWALLPNLGIMSSVAVGNLCFGFVPYAKFPEWFGKFSTTRKSTRLIREIRERCGHHLYTVKKAIQFEHVTLIFELVIKLLQTGQSPNILEAVSILIDLGLNVDMFKEHIVTVLPNQERADLFNQLPATVKSEFTKTYNKVFKSSIKAKKVAKGKDSTGSGNIPGTIGGSAGLNFNIDAAEDVQGTYSEDDSDVEKKDEDDVIVEVVEDKKGKSKAAAQQKPAAKTQKSTAATTSSRGRGRGRGGTKATNIYMEDIEEECKKDQKKKNKKEEEVEEVGFKTASKKGLITRARSNKK
eukprot:403362369